ncbi:MAG: peptide-methionine (R)-S-oxide reductase, partial [Rubritalea sp.]
METSNNAPEEPTEKVVKTEAEWKKILTEEQFRVARKS